MVESLANCAVCFDAYDQDHHVPLLLQCGHTFCQQCLTLLPDPVACPICRQREPRRVSQISKNILAYQIQAQLTPSEVQLCSHEDFYFYCKVCKSPLCVDCVVIHSSHSLVTLKDPGIDELITKDIEQIKGTYENRIDQCRKRKEQAEIYLANLENNYTKNREQIVFKFAEMQKMIENQERGYLTQIGDLFQDIYQNNEKNDNLHSSYRVQVKVDEDWLLSNLRKIGNIGINDTNREHQHIRRANNVRALNWKYSGRIDALSFCANKNIFLTAVGICTPYKEANRTKVDEFKILRGDTTRGEVVYLHSSAIVFQANLVDGVYPIFLETDVSLEANQLYTVYFKLSGAKTFKCVDSLVSVTGRDRTVFNFKNTQFVNGDESNRTDVQCGPIADLYYIAEAQIY